MPQPWGLNRCGVDNRSGKVEIGEDCIEKEVNNQRFTKDKMDATKTWTR